MNKYNDFHIKIKQFLDKRTVNFQHVIYDKSCHSIEEAVLASGESKENFVKNVCMIDNNENLIVAIVLGQHRASTSRVSKALGIDRPRLASLEEVFLKIGYPAGGVPSFGYNAIFLIDDKVMEKDYIITGGGSEYALIKIKTKDLIAVNNGKVARIRK